ncbi:MAG: rRNA cytosine-C5-methylase [Alphaproteobacteria bacterium]|nr:rRNA cytosine-C5-methylase [Alphaproteobacteria bacterium]
MTPAARVAAAIEVLGLIEALDRPADRVVERWFKGHRFAGSRDRAAINEIIYGVLRHRAALAWDVGRFAVEPRVGPRSLVLAELARSETLDHAGIAAHFDSSRYGPSKLTKEEDQLLESILSSSGEEPTRPDWVIANCPDWLFGEIRESLGDATAAELNAMQRRPALDLRANTIKATPEEVMRALAEEGVRAERCSHASSALRVRERASVRGTQAYRDGLVEIQDEGSQVAAALVDARSGQTVVDLCAGAGGKSLALAATMMNQGLMYACDVSSTRLQRMEPRLRRAGVTVVQPVKLSGVDDSRLDELANSADRVLVDAPCTGVGTIRRNPDLPWRLSPADIERNLLVQREILDGAAKLVAPGGRLIYVTCSLLESENGAQIRNFMAEHTDFHAMRVGPIWSDVLDSSAPDLDDTVLLTPARYGTDGFFVAVLERRE